MSGEEALRPAVEDDRIDRADFPQWLDPVVTALAVELVLPALEDPDVASEVRHSRPVAEPRARRGGREPGRTVVEQREHGIHPVAVLEIEGPQDRGNAHLV